MCLCCVGLFSPNLSLRRKEWIEPQLFMGEGGGSEGGSSKSIKKIDSTDLMKRMSVMIKAGTNPMGTMGRYVSLIIFNFVGTIVRYVFSIS